jgi:outer membrane PBP1 activator LpoA protein
MDEILQKLLSSELLSEDAKAEISTQWSTAVDGFKQTVREEVALEVRNELAEQWATERDALVEKVDTFVAEKLLEEISELKADIESFRDLEAEAAGKLVEAKHQMAEQLAEELDQLVDKMDAFFELRLTEEIAELKEDLEVVAQNDFGRRIFEAFATEFQRTHLDEESVMSKLQAATAKLEDVSAEVARLEAQNAQIVREGKLEKILAPLSGKKREQMSFVLANVETKRLEEAYNHFIGRVLKEDAPAVPAQVERKQPLTEGAKNVVITGEERAPAAQKNEDKFAEIRRLAGM